MWPILRVLSIETSQEFSWLQNGHWNWVSNVPTTFFFGGGFFRERRRPIMEVLLDSSCFLFIISLNFSNKKIPLEMSKFLYTVKMCWKYIDLFFIDSSNSIESLCTILIHILPASVARRNSRGDSAGRKNALRASALKNWSTALRCPSAARARWLILTSFFLFSYTILTSIERGC